MKTELKVKKFYEKVGKIKKNLNDISKDAKLKKKNSVILI